MRETQVGSKLKMYLMASTHPASSERIVTSYITIAFHRSLEFRITLVISKHERSSLLWRRSGAPLTIKIKTRCHTKKLLSQILISKTTSTTSDILNPMMKSRRERTLFIIEGRKTLQEVHQADLHGCFRKE